MRSGKDEIIQLNKSFRELRIAFKDLANDGIEAMRLHEEKVKAFNNFNPITDVIISKEYLNLVNEIKDLNYMKMLIPKVDSIHSYVEFVKSFNANNHNTPTSKLQTEEEKRFGKRRTWTQRKAKF